MTLYPNQYPVFAFNLIGILFFGSQYLNPMNYEFIIYIGVIILFHIILLATNKHVKYPVYLLWCMTAWSFFHMAGGLFMLNGDIWYNQILWPISETLGILRYDQLVHTGGFFTATLLGYEILKQHLKTKKITPGIGLMLIMIGAGFGALNEVIEFAVDTTVPESGVGGYINTALDLTFNFIGASFAVLFLVFRINHKTTPST